jgi:hypothetical protein
LGSGPLIVLQRCQGSRFTFSPPHLAIWQVSAHVLSIQAYFLALVAGCAGRPTFAFKLWPAMAIHTDLMPDWFIFAGCACMAHIAPKFRLCVLALPCIGLCRCVQICSFNPLVIAVFRQILSFLGPHSKPIRMNRAVFAKKQPAVTFPDVVVCLHALPTHGPDLFQWSDALD